MARTLSVRGGVESSPTGGVSEGIREAMRARLLPSQSALRRTVILLIAVFFLLLIAGTASNIIHGKQVALDKASMDLGLFADTVAAKFQMVGPKDTEAWQITLEENLPTGTTRQGRIVLIADAEGRIKATVPYDLSRLEHTIAQVIGSGQPLMAFASDAGVLPVTLSDGRDAIVTVRNIDQPATQLAMFQPQDRALEGWWRKTVFDITIISTTGLLLILIAAAFLSRPTLPAHGSSIAATRLADFDHVLGEAGCGLWDWNVARGQVRWSNSMFALLGLAPRDEDMSFHDAASFVHGDTDLYALTQDAMRDERDTIDETLRMRDAHGDWMRVRLSAKLMRDGDNGETHLIAAVTRSNASQSPASWSQAADARLRDAIESISEAFVLWDNDNRLVLCNNKFQQFHNLPESSVMPGTPYEHVLAAASEPLVRKRVVVTGDVRSDARTYEAQLENNRWLYIDERRTKDGGYVCVSTDITRLKQNEQKLFESEKEMKATVADLRNSRRELELQKQQLVILTEKYALEKNRAEAANRSKSQFLATFSHELRTPLNAIIGFSDVMQKTLFGKLGNAKYEEYARYIHESGTYLLEVINDILDMSKFEAGRMQLQIETLDLGEIIDDSIRVVAEGAKARDIKLKRNGAISLEIQADRRALKQTLLNLLANAVKFTPEGGDVKIRLARAPKGRVKIAIADTGIGIPEHEIKNLGRPFEQVENQFTKSHKGSGLGLAISRSLVEMHGGTIDIISKEGKGTTVTCFLPLRPVLMATDSDEAGNKAA